MRAIEHKGMSFEYDERCIVSYKWQKAMNSQDPGRTTRALEQLFCGRDEEYADMLCGNDDHDDLDTSMGDMTELLSAVLEDMGRTAKN